jgi:hypothetical protein
MDKENEQIRCKTCNTPILESTAATYSGNCARCPGGGDSSANWIGIVIFFAVVVFGFRSCNGIFSGSQSIDEKFVQMIVDENIRLKKNPPQTASSGVDKFNRFAGEVTRFDKASLIPELGNWAGRYENALYATRDVLQKLERLGSSDHMQQAMIDSFFRGANGDPLGRMQEESARNNGLRDEYQYCLNQLSRLASELQGIRDREGL